MVARFVALLAVLPLLGPEVWSGFRLGLSDPVLAALAAAEQPLSIRSPAGTWAIALTATWFGLGYWRRDIRPWEAVLVLAGGAAALARLGNAWLDALLVLAPLARQLVDANPRPLVLAVAAAVATAVAVSTLLVSRPPVLPDGASQLATVSPTRGAVFADWRWASDLQRRMGGDRRVLTAGGLAGQTDDFWLDYIRISHGHERWAAVLQALDVSLVVLESTDQQTGAADLIRTSSDWRVLYDADGALVAERSGS